MIVPEKSKTQTEMQEKIAQLCKALKQAEIEESLKGASTMINVLSPVLQRQQECWTDINF